MKYFTKFAMSLTIALGLMGLSVSSCQATVVVDPNVGGVFDFDWDDGLGPIDGINLGVDTDWSINAASNSLLSLAAATDLFVPGDEFELVFDGSVIAWDSTVVSGTGHFTGSIANLLLTAGLHTFSLNVTALALNSAGDAYLSGGASMEFGAVSAVPLPAALPLMAGGLGLMGFLGRKKQVAKA